MAFEGSDLAMSGLRKGSGNASPRRLRDRKAVARYAGLTGSPVRAADAGASGVLRAPVMLASGVA
jgi:hypothetical protein